MNMVKVFIKGQEDKELSSFLRYYPTRIKNVGIDALFDRQTIFDFKDGCNGKGTCEEVRAQDWKGGFLMRPCQQPRAQRGTEQGFLCTCMSVVGCHRRLFPCQGLWRAVSRSWNQDEERGQSQAT